ncbi:MAG: molybdate ABC transporter substrate-binding protein [Longimicrobiaceae bacterium]
MVPLAVALLAAAALLATACGSAADQDEAAVQVAVAANFAAAQQELARSFTKATGYQVRTSVGSTGQLYAQIVNGAPFDLLLAADRRRPRLLERRGSAVPGSRFTYARGRLVLYGPGLDSVRADGADLGAGRFTRLAVANPKTAPYGAAARQALARLELAEQVALRTVWGESVGQTYQFVRSGAAELGLVALSQVVGEPESSYWTLPEALHSPLLQQAVLLEPGAGEPAARAYLAFLRGVRARRIIAAYGYEVAP